MDSGPVGLSDVFLGSTTGGLVSDPETKQRRYGSGVGFLKQERDNNNVNEDDEWIIRSSKLVKTSSDGDFSVPNKTITTTMLRNSTTNNSNNSSSSLRSSTSNSTLFHDVTQPQQMLCFSAPKSESLAYSSSQTLATLPYFNYQPSFPNNYTGLNSGSLNGASMQGVLSGSRGPFTPSQWIELEHQALIFKYITSNVPVPSNLLLPIKKAFDSAGFSYYPGGFLRPTSLGWGSFHLGFSNTNDPEPGRCRRTDGKKWRCSRDAVADQKYCERHMNRGRHRSRKPVEGQTGHPVTGATAGAAAKQMPVSSSASASAVPGGGASSSLSIAHQQLKNLQSGVLNLSGDASANRFFMTKNNVGEKMQNLPGLSVVSPTIDLKSKENPFSMMRQQMPSEDSSQQKFGLDTSRSLLTASHKASALLSSRNFGSSQDLGDRPTESHSSIHQFMDTWPGNNADRSTLSWPDLNMQQDRTHLSISIPMTSSELISSTTPDDSRAALSPLRLSREFDQTQMNLGVGGVFSEPVHKQTNWIPISWETSMGGPLGEVLHNTNNGTTECKNSSALNLMTDRWDNSPPLGSSPTGVLQKTSFASLSNSSAGSSPRAEINKAHEGSNLSSNLLGSTLANPSSLHDL